MERNSTEELLLALRGKLWRDAYGMTWDRNRADDLLQETFTRALCNAGSFSGNNQQFNKWAYTIMRHAFIEGVNSKFFQHKKLRVSKRSYQFSVFRFPLSVLRFQFSVFSSPFSAFRFNRTPCA